MSTATVVVFVIAIVIVAVIALRVGGPRVTTIDRQREEEDREEGQ